MKSSQVPYLEVVTRIYNDACNLCAVTVSDLRDLHTIRSRVEEEGLSFLTITLPAFCRDFERSLAEGQVDPTYFQGFRKYGSIPAFLRGMIGLIFDRETGRIYDDETHSQLHPPLVSFIRQVCLTFKKLEMECTPKRVQTAVKNFVATESSFEAFSLPKEDITFFTRVSSVLWDNLLGVIRPFDLIPRHGPGATADNRSGNQKYRWKYWTERLEPYFPLLGTAYSSFDLTCDTLREELDSVTVLPEHEELPVKVICVPKTLKTPRIIAIEPTCMQYTQGGIGGALMSAIQSYWLTKGHVNFRDQSVNQSLAMIASSNGRLATIDLSDASDRVPWSLVQIMLSSNPDLLGAIDACRTRYARLPDGTVIGPLRKFASMGSALCFPIEAMYFYTLCVAASLIEHNLPVSQENIFNVSRDIYVYGDDILFPSTQTATTISYLQKYHCKVNSNKSFWTGKFRESCGVDCYNGELVTPTYLSQVSPNSRHDVSSLISWAQTANHFYMKGYWSTASYLYKRVEKFLGELPYLSSDSGGIGRTSFLGFRSINRWNEDLQYFEVRCWVPGPVRRTDELEGYGALTKSLRCIESKKDDSYTEDDHLELSARRHAVAIKRGWVRAS